MLKVPILSIVIPVYNVEDFLEECLNSILIQLTPDCELILVNDGSTDGSKLICERISNFYSDIYIYNTKNKGTSSARNLGIEKSKGEYIWFVDADDFIERDVISKILSILQELPGDVYKFDFNRIDESSEIKYLRNKEFEIRITKIINDNIESCFVSTVWNYIYKKSFIINRKIKFRRDHFYEDALFNLEVYSTLENLIEVDCRIYNYRIRKVGNKTSDLEPKVIIQRINSLIELIDFCRDQIKFKDFYEVKMIRYETLILENVNTLMSSKKNPDNQFNSEFFSTLKKNKIKGNHNSLKLKLYKLLFNFNLYVYFLILKNKIRTN